MKKILTFGLTVVILLGLCSGCILRELPRPAQATEETAETRPSGTDETGETTETAETLTGTEDLSTVDKSIRPRIWRVTANGHTLYLFGTIHLGDERSEDVLKMVKGKLLSCEALAVELDIVAEESSGESLTEILSLYALTDGTTIRDHLSPELFGDVTAFLREGGLDSFTLRQFERYHPALWMELVDEILAETEMTLDYDWGMDRLLIHAAYENKIKVLEVEEADAHYGVELGLPDAFFEKEIRSLLDEREEYADDVLELYEEWLRGDWETNPVIEMEEEDEKILSPYFTRQELEDIKNGVYAETAVLRMLIERLPEDVLIRETEYTSEELKMYLKYEEEMLDVRNGIMADQAKNYLKEYKNTFFAVGAAHMEGPTGVIRLLQDAGYTVEEIPIR